MESCIYEGQVSHARSHPVKHAFRYRVFMMYLDLEELPSLFKRRWFWSTRHAAPARFRRADHMGPESQSLADSVRDLVESETGSRPQGPVRILTNLSYFGYCFNPVSFYYCFDANDRNVETIVAEVNNTPWGERHVYVLNRNLSDARSDIKRFALSKEFHVSPFLPMELDYDWRFSTPERNISVHMNCMTQSGKIFDATLALERRRITGWSLASTAARYPLMSLKIVAGIYWQALKLWLKGTPFYDHPNQTPRTTYNKV